MSEEPQAKYDIVVARLTQRLHGYAQGLGIDDTALRQIVERIVADMPEADDVDRQVEARNWMLMAVR
ncbi:hypothetical protein MKK88_07270 [Methylobacterium sp. E-005]|uniref:hypothetical protein n=1 Tax=Methylobacterium sp. E-005 TaxID=2836549 RepID=UPI001FB8DCF9|nr:hypothetical protein [Methylobacterium sp. E-005]MCJ2085794.1 hypothetical protein [Methylobacterium sp. E-005]